MLDDGEAPPSGGPRPAAVPGRGDASPSRRRRPPPPPAGRRPRWARASASTRSSASSAAAAWATVYLARDDRLGRRVAIKFLQTGNAELTRRFIVEARATARCSHENIVVIYEVGELQGSPYMVLEYLQGQTAGGGDQEVRADAAQRARSS